MQQCLVRPTSCLISLTFKYQSTSVVLVKLLAVAGRTLCLSGCFLGIGSLDFSEFWHGARNPYEVVHDRARVFGKNNFGNDTLD